MVLIIGVCFIWLVVLYASGFVNLLNTGVSDTFCKILRLQ